MRSILLKFFVFLLLHPIMSNNTGALCSQYAIYDAYDMEYRNIQLTHYHKLSNEMLDSSAHFGQFFVVFFFCICFQIWQTHTENKHTLHTDMIRTCCRRSVGRLVVRISISSTVVVCTMCCLLKFQAIFTL